MRKFLAALLAATAALWSTWVFLPHFAPDSLEIWMLNVGQGESVLVREPSGKLLLYDGGPDDSVLSELGDILPPWQRTLDLVVLSHNHTDHFFGLISVLQRYTVKDFWWSDAKQTGSDFVAFTKALTQNGTPRQSPFFNQAECTTTCPIITPFGQARIQVYHPLQDMRGKVVQDQHDATLSIKVSYANESIFLAGDLNEGHEQDMLAACVPPRCDMASTLLQVPHHGSATGLLPDFLSAIHPRYALIPVGLHNIFHHPTAIVLQRLQAAHIPTYRTDTQGRIHAILSRDGHLKISAADDG